MTVVEKCGAGEEFSFESDLEVVVLERQGSNAEMDLAWDSFAGRTHLRRPIRCAGRVEFLVPGA